MNRGYGQVVCSEIKWNKEVGVWRETHMKSWDSGGSLDHPSTAECDSNVVKGTSMPPHSASPCTKPQAEYVPELGIPLAAPACVLAFMNGVEIIEGASAFVLSGMGGASRSMRSTMRSSWLTRSSSWSAKFLLRIAS